MSTPYLDVAIGLALIYLTFAISVTSLNEALSSLLKLRGRLLRERLRQLFGKEDADALLKDPLLASLSLPPHTVSATCCSSRQRKSASTTGRL